MWPADTSTIEAVWQHLDFVQYTYTVEMLFVTNYIFVLYKFSILCSSFWMVPIGVPCASRRTNRHYP